MFEDLREASLAALVELDLPGYAVGGVSVGEPKEDMRRIVAHTPHRLPADKPRYLMGVGTPEDLVDGVAARRRHVRLRDADAQRAQRPPVHALRRPAAAQRALQDRRAADRPRPARCHACARLLRAPTCTTSTAAARCSAPMLASIHNLHYYLDLMREVREALDAGRFDTFAQRLSRPTARAASEGERRTRRARPRQRRTSPYRRRRGRPTARRALAACRRRPRVPSPGARRERSDPQLDPGGLEAITDRCSCFDPTARAPPSPCSSCSSRLAADLFSLPSLSE